MIIPGHARIAIDPAVCGGRPTVAGTRGRATDVLEMLAGGVTAADFPLPGRGGRARGIRLCGDDHFSSKGGSE